MRPPQAFLSVLIGLSELSTEVNLSQYMTICIYRACAKASNELLC